MIFGGGGEEGLQEQHRSDRQPSLPETAARISKTSPGFSFIFWANHLLRSDVGYRTSKLTRSVLLGPAVCGWEKKDSTGSVGPKEKKKQKKTRTQKKDNGKEENSSASLGKTRISRDFLFAAGSAGPQPACDVGIKERR